jgi:transposase
LDVRKLVSMLMRYQHGERHGWHVVNGPSVKAEDQRHLHRDLETLKQERARTTNRIKGLLRSQGDRLTSVHQLPAPPGLPALVKRRLKHRVTGVRARTDRRSLETDGSQRHRKLPDQSRACDTAPKECRKNIRKRA